MPKRSIYLQPPDNSCRRTRRDIEFLCNYWNRLLTLNRSYDVRLPELLRANHLMRHLSPLSMDRGLTVNVSFTVLDENDFSRPDGVHSRSYQSGSSRSPCNANTARCNNLLGDYARRASENYAAAIERELIRAGVLASLIDRERTTGCRSAFYNQRAAAGNYRFPTGNRASATRVFSGQQERCINPRKMNNCHACASFQQRCCAVDSTNKTVKRDFSINQQPLLSQEDPFEKYNDSPNTAAQRQISLQTSSNNLQPNNKTLQNRATALLERNDNALKRVTKEPMEVCQGASKTIIGAKKIPRSAGPKPVAINNDEGSIDSAGPSCRQDRKISLESSIATNQLAEGQGRGNKRKLNDMKDCAAVVDRASQDPPRPSGRIKPRIKNASMTFPPDENAIKIARGRARNGRLSDFVLSSRRRLSSPKYASFLRMFRKEEVADERLRGKSLSGKNEDKKSQCRGRLSTDSSSPDNDNQVIRPRIERKTPTPRNTVHTTYNPIMHSSASDPILDSSGITIQLLRLAILLYAPALMPALNSLVAQQNQQTPISLPSFEGSNDTWTQVFRLFNEQQTIANLSLVSAGSERDSPVLSTETATKNPSSEEQKNISIATEKPTTSQHESISAKTSGWKSNNRLRENEKDKKWRLTSMLNSDLRLGKSIFATEDLWKLEEFLKNERRPENVRSLSTRSKNEIVMKESFQGWLGRLLQQLDANGANGNSSSNDEEKGYPEGSTRTTPNESFRKRTERRRNRDSSAPDALSNTLNSNSNILTEHEEEDSDDQKYFTSTTSTNSSSSSLQLEQDDAKKNDSQNENPQN